MTINTISSDTINSGTPVGFLQNSQEIVINPGVIVGATGVNQPGLVSLGHSQSTLDNFGVVFSIHDTGVFFSGFGGLIKNENSATINGDTNGIALDGNTDTIQN